jgi:hypothetical protein
MNVGAMAATDDIPRSWTLPSLGALALIAVAPPCLAIALGDASWISVAAGALIWFASVCVKRIVIQSARRLAPFWPLSSGTVAALHGTASAIIELGAAAIYLSALPSASLSEVLAFGAGAGSAEAAYVLALGIIHPQVDPDELRAWMTGAAVSWCVRYAVPVERLFALIGHVGSRGLLYVALMQQSSLALLWGMAAVLLFALIDGVAVYGHLKQWQWHDPVICRRAHSFFAAVSITEFALMLVAFQRG